MIALSQRSQNVTTIVYFGDHPAKINALIADGVDVVQIRCRRTRFLIHPIISKPPQSLHSMQDLQNTHLSPAPPNSARQSQRNSNGITD